MAEAATFEAVPSGGFRVRGELTFGTVTRLSSESAPLFASGPERLEVDLGEVSRADSAGLALLIEWLRRARENGKAILFRRVPPQIRAIARVSDLEGILPWEEE